MNDARLKEIEHVAIACGSIPDDKAIELIRALRESQAREAKLREALEAIETGDQSLGGKFGTVKDLRFIAREALKETKP